MKIILSFCVVLTLWTKDINGNESGSAEEKENILQKYIELQYEISQLRLDNFKLKREVQALTKPKSCKTNATTSIFVKNILAESLTSIEQNLDPLRSFASDNFKVVITLSKDSQSTNVDLSVPSLTSTKSCSEVRPSGVYRIQNIPYRVSCDATTRGGGWTVIQRRIDGSVDFYRPWAEYKKGFGKLNGEFFIGLENLHLMTTYEKQELLILMEDFKKERRYARYRKFEIGGEREHYVLKELGEYSGDAGDSLGSHKSQKFSTYDQDNDLDSRNCAQLYHGAWWYLQCHESNLNGLYNSTTFGRGINWFHYKGHTYSLKFVEMMIRPIVT